jgi:LTXXQ motif family protein
MAVFRSLVIAATLIAVVPAVAQSPAQTQPPPPAPPQTGMPSPGMMGGGNMMGQGQMGWRRMMSMMNMMMRGQAGAEHIEGRLAFIKAELKITDAQVPQWTAFVEAVRNNANSTSEMRNAMMSQSGGAATLPERLAREEKLVAAHLAALKQIEDAVNKLYGVLSDDQKKIADGIVIGPMGMPMGML